jgi:SAM-dependent methyltransferase
MARQPKLILRESAIDDVVKDWPIGSFLETGAGTGYMTRKFLECGYSGACFELGLKARELLRQNLATLSNQITVLDSLDELGTKTFDYLLTFEVLEHIEDDLAVLREWSNHLKRGGKILLSVPAHQKKYGKSDELVGHLRRYERSDVISLLEKAGYTDINIINYGFPISEITRPLSNVIVKQDKPETNDDKPSMAELSMRSSHTRQPHIQKIINLVGERPMAPFRVVQRFFYQRDWGDGIIATASKT